MFSYLSRRAETLGHCTAPNLQGETDLQGPTHLAIGWLLGEHAGLRERRDRRIVGLAGLVPDIDVLVYPLAYMAFAGNLDQAHTVYALVHHRYTHGILFAFLCAGSAWRLASNEHRLRVALLTLTAAFLHIVGDAIGSGSDWPVYPLAPFSDWSWGVEWSIRVSDWRNVLLSATAIALTLWWSYSKGYSMLECFSYRADDWMAAVMRGKARSSRRFRIVFYAILFGTAALTLLPLVFYLR